MSSRMSDAELKKKRLDIIAAYAMTDPRFIEQPGWCQTLAREVVQFKHGNRFDRYFYKGNAHNTARALSVSPYVVKGEPMPGDVLYWYGTPQEKDGHAAILGRRGRFYENSIVHNHPEHGGKGTRYLSQKRKPDVIVRFP